jgi:hypothetical protein
MQGTSWAPLTSNDRILAALGYVFWFVALIVLLLDGTKNKPLLRAHAIQALGVTVAAYAYGFVASIVFICSTLATLGIAALFLWVIFFVPLALQLYWAFLSYDRPSELVEIPWLTEFMARQGWLQRATH